MAAKASAESLARWRSREDAALTDFQDYQVKMVDQDLMAFLDAMGKTIPGQVDLVMMDFREPLDCLGCQETMVWQA